MGEAGKSKKPGTFERSAHGEKKLASSAALTADALTALDHCGISRRDFLKTSGALIVAFSILGRRDNPVEAQEFEGGSAGSPPAARVDSWIAVAADGKVTAFTGKAEIGQGMSIAQTQLIAEQLSVPLDRVTLIYCDTALTPDQGVTSGSQSSPANFNHKNLAQAAATAREALCRMASAHLGVVVDQLTAADGIISVKSDPSKKVGYGELVAGKKLNLAVDPKAKRKPANEWTVLGKPIQRADIPEVVTGKFEFVHNVRLPNMLHGRVVRPPTVGATVVSVDESSVRDLPGVVKVVVKKNFVGVVAEKQWQAVQAAKELKVTWTPGAGLPSQAKFYEYLREQPARDTLMVASPDVQEKLSGAATVVQATYYHPYQMHGSVGSSCAVADVAGDKATIWSPTQGVWPLRSAAAMILGLKPEHVRVIFRRGSGCYGLNGADTVSFDAALLSQAVAKPVRVQLSRQDEMAWENYGFAFVIDQRAGLDAQGNIVCWDYESWYPSLGNRPGYTNPGNVITGMLAGFPYQEFVPRSPAPEPKEYNNRSNAVPSYVAGCIGDECEGTGKIKTARVLAHNVKSHFPTGPLRSPQRLQNTFAHECFMDEVAKQAKMDPVDYRLRHLSDSRLIAVLNAAAKQANWQARPSPKSGTAKSGIVTGHGVACVSYEGDNGYCAMIVEVEVNQDSGSIAVKRIVAAGDCGPISNPDGLKNQFEGGALHGMSRALLEEVTWDDQKVTSIDWRSYRSLPLGFDIPKIETVLINRPDQPATGAGETAITVIGAAIGNAVSDATGARLRQIPFTPERVKASLNART
jgi:CO/xanthine dehydrogenase Mo-binding subunit